MFTSLFSESISTSGVLIASATSILMGWVVAKTYMIKNNYSKGFIATLMILPFLIQVVIMMVNGNLGTSVAILGAFGLIRFRSIAGTARDISNIFLAMALGLANGMGHVVFGIFVLLIATLMNLLIYLTEFGNNPTSQKELRIIIPENLDYEGIFDDILTQYTDDFTLTRVKTTAMGSMFELRYLITLNKHESTKEFLDAIRVRNGNLNIVLGQVPSGKEEL